MKRRKWVLAAVGAALVVTLGAGAAMAQAGEENGGVSFLDRVATKLGVDRPQLDQAIQESRDEEIDERVAAGDLTQEDADRLKERLDDVPDGGFFPLDGPPGDHRFRFEFRGGDGHRFEFDSDDLEGFAPKLKGAGFGLFEMHDKLAEFLGVDEDALLDELQADGATLGSIAEAHGKSREELRDFLLAELRTGVDKAVEEGWLPQDGADRLYDRIAEHVDRFIDSDFGMPNFPRLFEDREREDGDEDAPQRSEEPVRSFRS